MSAANEGEFDLLQYIHLSSVKDNNQLTREERQMLSLQRRHEIDETQYISHCVHDKIKRVREQFGLRGRASKPNSCTRDATDKFGFFWFGQGKYDYDHYDKRNDVVGGTPSERKQEQTESLDNRGASSLLNVPDEEQFKVWRPIEAPPLRRQDVMRAKPLPADAKNRHQVTKGVSFSVGRKKSALTPPWAEHYSTENNNSRNRTNCVGKRQHKLFESGVLPRGVGGIDDVLGAARNAQDLVITLQEWRMREDRQQNQRLLKDALDMQLSDKRKRQLKQYEEDLVQIYGPTMRHILADTFGEQSNRAPVPLYSNNEHIDDDDENESGLVSHQKETQSRCFRQRMDTAETRLRQSRRAWLAAWEDHKKNLVFSSHPKTPCVGGEEERNMPSGLDMTPFSSPSVLQFMEQQQRRRRKAQDPHRDTPKGDWDAGVAGLNRSSSLLL